MIEFNDYERKVASEYHSGQFTELYKVSSSGKYDNKELLIKELKDANHIAWANSYDEDWEVTDTMLKKLGYCGFCQGECKVNHYVSSSSEGY